MTDLIPFAFEEKLVRAIDRGGEPWFAGKDVCDCLDIVKHHQALESLDDEERGTCTVGTPGGQQSMIVISEPGVYRLIFQSRKPVAKKFQRWVVHEVLPSIRKTGKYAIAPDAQWASEGATQERLTDADLRTAPLLHRLNCIREVRSIAGRSVARIMWNRLGLPPLPPPPPSAMDEARQCLRQLLDACVYPDGPTVRDCLEQALDDSAEHQALLLTVGVRALPDVEAFAVCNDHPGLRRVFERTPWAGSHGHMRVLRRLTGAGVARQTRFEGIQRRGTLLPAEYLDEEFKGARDVRRIDAR